MRTVRTTGLPELSENDRRRLLEAARDALTEHLGGAAPAEAVRETDWPVVLRQPFATFVTLRDGTTGELRGCRGEIHARQSLVHSVREMAVASATGDLRFDPVGLAEVDLLSIDISVLGPLCSIAAEDVEVGRHGLMISRGYRSGLLLPSVPITLGWDRDQFLAGLCAKAGLPASAWREDDAELLAFETVSWGDSTPAC